jgi:Uma2 family endonuclease
MNTSKRRTRKRISASSAGLRMSLEEFDAISNYDDRYSYELIRGILAVTPLPAAAEAGMNDELNYLLRSYRDRHPQGAAMNATLYRQYIRTADSSRLVSRAVWAGLGRRPRSGKELPAIAIDIVPAGKRDWLRDYDERRKEYLDLGVAEYWVIDRFRRTMTVYRNISREPAEQVVAEEGVYCTDLLPGFELPLARLWAEADDWKPRKKTAE